MNPIDEKALDALALKEANHRCETEFTKEKAHISWCQTFSDIFKAGYRAAAEKLGAELGALREIRDAAEEVMESPRWVEQATVPKAGIDAAPGQAVMNASIALLKIRRLDEALSKLDEIRRRG